MPPAPVRPRRPCRCRPTSRHRRRERRQQPPAAAVGIVKPPHRDRQPRYQEREADQGIEAMMIMTPPPAAIGAPGPPPPNIAAPPTTTISTQQTIRAKTGTEEHQYSIRRERPESGVPLERHEHIFHLLPPFGRWVRRGECPPFWRRDQSSAERVEWRRSSATGAPPRSWSSVAGGAPGKRVRIFLREKLRDHPAPFAFRRRAPPPATDATLELGGYRGSDKEFGVASAKASSARPHKPAAGSAHGRSAHEMTGEREEDERCAGGGQLHAGREPALHQGDVAGASSFGSSGS